MAAIARRVTTGLRRNAPLRFLVVAEAEPQELPLYWSSHRTLGLVHLELEPSREKARDVRHHPLSRSSATDVLRCRQKIRELTRRTRGISLEQILKELTAYLRGWKSYFGFCQTPSLLKALDEWIRRRLRSMIWKQWKRGKQRYAKLRHLGIGRDLAAQSQHGPWHLANSPALALAIPIAYFDSLGLPRLLNGDA